MTTTVYVLAEALRGSTVTVSGTTCAFGPAGTKVGGTAPITVDGAAVPLSGTVTLVTRASRLPFCVQQVGTQTLYFLDASSAVRASVTAQASGPVTVVVPHPAAPMGPGFPTLPETSVTISPGKAADLPAPTATIVINGTPIDALQASSSPNQLWTPSASLTQPGVLVVGPPPSAIVAPSGWNAIPYWAQIVIIVVAVLFGAAIVLLIINILVKLYRVKHGLK